MDCRTLANGSGSANRGGNRGGPETAWKGGRKGWHGDAPSSKDPPTRAGSVILIEVAARRRDSEINL